MSAKVADTVAFCGTLVLFAGLALQFFKFECAPYVYLLGPCCLPMCRWWFRAIRAPT